MTGLQKVDFKKLIAKLADEKKDVAKKPTKAEKIKGWMRGLSEIPEAEIEKVDSKLINFVPERFAKVVPTEVRELSRDELVAVAQELVDANDIKEMMEGVRERVKTAFFNHLNAENAHLDEPDTATGVVELPEIGIKMQRTTTGYADPTLDEEALRKALGDKADLVFTTKTETVVVTTHEMDKDALAMLIVTDPEVEDLVTKLLVPGKKRSGTFLFQTMPKSEDE